MQLSEVQRSDKVKRLHELKYEMAKADFMTFFRKAWSFLEPDTNFMENWHHGLIGEYLTAVKNGQIKRLIINVAPRTTKSLETTVCFPCWWWSEEPFRRFLFGSYSSNLATSHSVLRRNLIESPWYQEGYPYIQLASDQNMKTEFVNTSTGFMKSAGIKAGVTGHGGDCIIFDDPQDPAGAESDTERESTLNALDLKWSTRLNDRKTGRIILIMQRLHKNDATAHLMSKNVGYEHVVIPTIAEGPTTIIFPLSGRKVERKDGELLHPARDGETEINNAKKDLGSFGFAGQHQQQPVPREGAMIKLNWLKFYTDWPEPMDEEIQSWDCAFKGDEKSAPVCGLILARKGADFYLYHKRFYGQADLPATIVGVKSLTAARPEAIGKYVENKANGPGVVATLKKVIPGMKEFDPNKYGNKESRLAMVSPVIESGNYHLPDPSICPWIHEYIEELTTFPRSRFKDQVDATSQGLIVLNKRRNITDWTPSSITAPSKWK